MGNDLTLLYKSKSQDGRDNLFARRYLEDGTKSYLVDSIKQKTKQKLQEDPGYQQKKITENLLIDEAFGQYPKMDRKDKLSLLLHHPGLLKEDFEDILEMSVKTTEKAFYTALTGSVVTYLIYKKWIERHHIFYNFFRKKSRFRGVGVLKKTLGGLILYFSWLAGAKYFYTEQLKGKVFDKGYLKKYVIDPEAVYVEDDD